MNKYEARKRKRFDEQVRPLMKSAKICNHNAEQHRRECLLKCIDVPIHLVDIDFVFAYTIHERLLEDGIVFHIILPKNTKLREDYGLTSSNISQHQGFMIRLPPKIKINTSSFASMKVKGLVFYYLNSRIEIKPDVYNCFITIWEKLKNENMKRREILLSRVILVKDVAKYITEFIQVLSLEEEIEMMYNFISLRFIDTIKMQEEGISAESLGFKNMVAHLATRYHYMLEKGLPDFVAKNLHYSRNDYSLVL
jgi:hypothetical protein